MTVTVDDLQVILRLKDELTGSLAIARKNIATFAKDNEQSFKSIGQAVGLASSAVIGLAGTIAVLGKRGSDVADVAESFDDLSKRAGAGGNALDVLRTSVDGLVSDFDLMKTSNIAFSQGLKLSEDQLKLTGEASRVLADRIGGDTAEAYGTLTRAMATGMDRQLKSVGLNIDAKAATEAYALSIGKEVQALTENEQILAKRNAILSAMTKVLEQSGRAELDFGEKIDRAVVTFKNFTDALGVGIAQSPVLNAGLDSVGRAIQDAFGANQAETIKTLIGLVEDFTLAILELGATGLKVAKFLHAAWTGLNALFTGTLGTFTSLLASAQETVVVAANAMGTAIASAAQEGSQAAKDADRLFAYAEERASSARELRAIQKSFQDQTDEAIDKEAAWRATLDASEAALAKMSAAMRAAGGAQAGMTKTTQALTDALKPNEEQLRKSAEAAKKLFEALEKEALRGSMEADEAAIKRAADEADRLANELLRGAQASEDWELAQAADEAALSFKLMSEEMKKTVTFGDSFKAGLANLPSVILGALQGGGNVFKSVLASLGGTIGEALKTTLTGSLSKALGSGIGAALGSIIPGLGTALGAVAGDFVGKLMEKMTATKGKIMGAILGGPAGFLLGGFLGGQAENKRVNDLRDSFVAAAGGLDRLRAEAFTAGLSLDKLLAAKTVKDFDAAVKGLKGSLSGSFDDIRAAAEKAGTVGDRALVGLLKRMRELGGESYTPEMRAFTAEKLNASAGFLKQFVDAFAKLPEKIGDFGGLSAVSFMANFEAIAAEKGKFAAVEQLAEMFDTLRERLGATGNEAAVALLEPFERIRGYLADETLGPLLGMTDALRGMMVNLADAGYLNVETFSAMQQGGAALFDELLAGGMALPDALEALAPTIQAAISAAEQFGVPLDENMQRLRETAEQNGITFRTDPMERMVDILSAIAVKLGAEIPESVTRAATSFEALGDTTTTTLGDAVMQADDAAASISKSWDVGTGIMIDVTEDFTRDFADELTGTADFADTVFGYMTDDFADKLGAWGDIAERAVDEVNAALENINDATINLRINAPNVTDLFPGFSVTPAAHGFHAEVSRPSLLLVGERGPERVDVTPRGQPSGISVTYAPTITVTGAGNDREILRVVREELNENANSLATKFRQMVRSELKVR